MGIDQSKSAEKNAETNRRLHAAMKRNSFTWMAKTPEAHKPFNDWARSFGGYSQSIEDVPATQSVTPPGGKK